MGTSLLNPAKPFMDLWYKVNQSFPDYKLHLVPFEDNHEGILSEIEKLGVTNLSVLMHRISIISGILQNKAFPAEILRHNCKSYNA